MDPASLGTGFGIAFIILTTVFGFLLKWKKIKEAKNGNGKSKKLSMEEERDLYEWTRDLWEWHNRTNDDGVFVWYVSGFHIRTLQEIQKTLAALQHVSENQIKLLERLEDRIQESLYRR